MDKMGLILAGSGGQGVILASVILAEAAVNAGQYVAQSQSYGPEARGGACRGEVLISDQPIGYTKVQTPTCVVALTQKAFDEYCRDLPEECFVLADMDIDTKGSRNGNCILRLPILESARNEIGRPQTANMIAVGCINELLNISNRSQMKRAVAKYIPESLLQVNLRALEYGGALIRSLIRHGACS